MSKSRKITHRNFQAYETKEISFYLEQMDERHYILSKIIGNLYVFEYHSDEKETYRYAVIHDERSFHVADMDTEMRQLLREYGYEDWEFVCRKPGMIICKKAGSQKGQIKGCADFKKWKDMRRENVCSFSVLLSIAAAIIICGAGLFVMRIKFPLGSDFQQMIIHNVPFIIGTGAFLAFFIYYIGELYDYVVQNHSAGENTTAAVYQRTKVKRVMFQAGDVFGAIFILFSLIYGIYIGSCADSVMDMIWILFVFVLSALYLSPLNSGIKGCHAYLLFIAMYCYMISCFFVLYR